MKESIKVIGFDADDTLWVNELNYKETEERFCALMKDYLPAQEASRELFKTEVQNMELYGYGAKAFFLSIIETAIRISNKKLDADIIQSIIELGKEQLNKPIILLDGVIDCIEDLYPKYKLIIATKGDLLDQERKMMNSGLEKYFHHIEVMSDKQTKHYQFLLEHMEIKPEEFLMIGNSLKSDIIPVLELGGYAVHVPYHTNWEYEKTDAKIESQRFFEVNDIREVSKLL